MLKNTGNAGKKNSHGDQSHALAKAVEVFHGGLFKVNPLRFHVPE
jgi:hypothetical protein